MKKPFLKGKLTKLSAALLALVQMPNIVGQVSDSVEVFAQNSNAPISIISLAAAAGIFWGGIRRAFNYARPALVLQAAEEEK